MMVIVNSRGYGWGGGGFSYRTCKREKISHMGRVAEKPQPPQPPSSKLPIAALYARRGGYGWGVSPKTKPQPQPLWHKNGESFTVDIRNRTIFGVSIGDDFQRQNIPPERADISRSFAAPRLSLLRRSRINPTESSGGSLKRNVGPLSAAQMASGEISS